MTTLIGGSGADQLSGGSGNDTYLLVQGSGYDIISDSSGSDRISFGQGISASRIKVSQVRRLGDSSVFEYTDQGQGNFLGHDTQFDIITSIIPNDYCVSRPAGWPKLNLLRKSFHARYNPIRTDFRCSKWMSGRMIDADP